MIVCQNCGKEIAEDSAHCGHCGAAVEVSNKKTMMGFGGAIDSDALKAELEKAKAKREGQDQEEASTEGEDERSMAPTEMMDVGDLPEVDDESASEDDDLEEFATAKTAAMEKVDSSQDELPSLDAEEPDEEQGTPEEESDQRWEIDPASEVDTPAMEPSSMEEEKPSEDKPESEPSTSPEGAGAPPSGGRDLMSMGGAGSPSGDAEGTQVEVEEDDGNRRLMLILIVVLGLMVLCCVLSVVGFFVSGGLEMVDAMG